MRLRFFLFLFLGPIGAVLAQKIISLEDCFTHFRFYPAGAGEFKYLKDGIHHAEAEGLALHFFDVRNPKFDSTVALVLPEAVASYDGFEFSPDETKLLLRTETEPVYRHSVLANYYVYDLVAKQAVPIFETDRQQFIAFAPDGQKVAFVSGNNLYYKDLRSGKTVQVTQDGKPNEVINGLPDWVYEEEFSPVDGDGMVATVWSPDATKIAFLRFDERQVPQMQLTWYEGETYPRYSFFKYPKVGERNSTVTAHIYDLQTGKTTTADTGAEADIYLPRLQWTPDARLTVTRLNRAQDHLEILLVNGATGKTSLLHEERDPAYVEIESENKLLFLKQQPRFIWMSEQSGYMHLYLHPTNPAAAIAPYQLTKGDYDVTAFYGVDEANGVFYYQTATPTPMDRQIWEGRLDGGTPRLITPGDGTHEVQFCPTFDYCTITRSDANTPPMASLYNRSGQRLRDLVDNQRVVRVRKEYGFSTKTFMTIPIPDGPGLNAWIIKPANFDPTRRYPVLFDIYGGPGSQTVENRYDGYYDAWRQMLAQKGYIVISVDNRGTGARGRNFKKCTQLQLGKLETDDQIAAARYLGTLPYVDASRIGIWGWSFGGYLSTSCILKGADVFKAAIAVAPVVNWKWYDSAYTERYMRGVKDNLDGYDKNSPIFFAKQLRGDNYLLCHGMADDNVHWQHSVEMINALIRENKQFETYAYPNRNHGIYGDNATMHLFTKITEFILNKI